MIACCLSRAMCPCARPFKTSETALRDTPTRSATSCAVALRTTFVRFSRALFGNTLCRLTRSLEFCAFPHPIHVGRDLGRNRLVRPLASRVEWGAVEDEQAVGDLAVLDGDAFGTGSALDWHRFGVVHDYRLLVVAKGGNEF